LPRRRGPVRRARDRRLRHAVRRGQGGGGNDQDAYHTGGGTVYSLSGTTLTTLYRFCAERNCRDGAYPVGQLVVDADGNLFGATQTGGKYGAGVVFELSP
jgi:uncharacterized repeat protein (TIGR03803 family)